MESENWNHEYGLFIQAIYPVLYHLKLLKDIYIYISLYNWLSVSSGDCKFHPKLIGKSKVYGKFRQGKISK
jgi:hypothetical protein